MQRAGEEAGDSDGQLSVRPKAGARFSKADAEGDRAHSIAPLGVCGSLKLKQPPPLGEFRHWPCTRKQLKTGAHDKPSMSLILPHVRNAGFRNIHFFFSGTCRT